MIKIIVKDDLSRQLAVKQLASYGKKEGVDYEIEINPQAVEEKTTLAIESRKFESSDYMKTCISITALNAERKRKELRARKEQNKFRNKWLKNRI